MLALQTQLLFELERFNAEENSIESIFIGGGTPSTLAPTLYAPLFEILRPYLQDSIEITSEANPNSASLEWLRGIYALGVNRISFGVQSFNAEKLKILNRAHTPQMALDAITNAKSVGFKNISLDLIYATLGDTKELLEDDISTALSLPINHLSAYALTIEEGTAFEHKKEMSKEQLKLTHSLFKRLKEHNFEQYEISNFGTYRSVHNLGYWRYKDYMGVGAGAVGKRNAERFYPTTDIEAYIKNPLDIELESLSSEDIKIEKVLLGLRSCIGVASTLLNAEEKKRAELLCVEKKLTERSGKYYSRDFLLADEIALFLTS